MTTASRFLAAICASFLLGGGSAASANTPAFAVEATPSERVAVVIGNSAYTLAPLRNPGNDARAVASALRRYGFAVHEFLDLKAAQSGQVRRLIRETVSGDTTLLFYYAGHGIQADGENLLPAVDASLSSLGALKEQSLRLNDLLADIEAASPRSSVIILDACRDNPLEAAAANRSSSRGLARAVAPPGAVVFYATRPGSTASDGTGENGLFTEVLLREMADPKMPLELLFRRVSSAVFRLSRGEQEPWVEGVIRDEVVLARLPAPPMPADAPSPVAQTNPVALVVPDPPATAPVPTPVPAPEPTLVQAAAPAPAPQPILIAQADALRSLKTGSASGDGPAGTRWFCENAECRDYGEAFAAMRRARSFPQLIDKIDKIDLCEFDAEQMTCSKPFLDHGTGISPAVPFMLLFGSRVVTKGIRVKDHEVTNGGGLSFVAESQLVIERSRLGTATGIKCSDGSGRLELMSDRLEFELTTSFCIQPTPPIPWPNKLTANVVLYDHTNKDLYVEWRSSGFTFGAVFFSNGIARLSLR